MTQHRRASLREAATQATVGLPVEFAVSFGIGLLGLSPAAAAALITLAMYAISILRGYLIRRRFERRPAP
jgi:hypothetical protein